MSGSGGGDRVLQDIGDGAVVPESHHAHHHHPRAVNHHAHNHYHHLPGRYYATERRRRHGYPSFSIMKWFRKGKHCGDDADSTWFRNDLMRLRQAYLEHEPDYAAVTPIAARHHRRPKSAATWSRWSGSTTTVYSFAYVDGEQVERQPSPPIVTTDEDDDDEPVYIDAATLPVAQRRFGQSGAPTPSSSTATTSSRTTPSTAGTMTSTYRRRYKKAAAPPPPPLAKITDDEITTVVGTQQKTSSPAQKKTPSVQQQKTSTVQRRTATIGRKKYKAPQPPTPQPADVQPAQTVRRPVHVYRRKKGPAPKPPVQQQQQQQQQQRTKQDVAQPVAAAQQAASRPKIDGGSNVKRKISQYERERLMQRVDKIEKHFLQKNTTTTHSGLKNHSETVVVTKKTGLPWTTSGGGARQQDGFASPAALFSDMAATNLTELDRRAAEICRRRNRLQQAAEAQRPVSITDDHKNAIVAAVMRKSYPAATTTTTTAAVADEKRRDETGDDDRAEKMMRDDRVQEGVATDDLQQVRRKRLAFFQQRAGGVSEKRQTVHGKDASTGPDAATAAAMAVVAAAAAAAVVERAKTAAEQTKSPGRAAAKTSSSGTQTMGSVVEAKTLPRSSAGGGRTSDRGSSSESINLPSGDNNCYQQLMAMEMQTDLVLHNGPFECAVCLCTYDNNGVVLRDCLHVFCRPCLQMTITHSNAEQVECPYIDEKYSCTGVLQHREIKKILDSDEEYERFLQRSVDRARQLLAKERNGASFQCRRPDCTGWCMIYDKHQVLEFKCPVCGTVTCVQCGSIHTQREGCKKKNDIYNSDGNSQDTLENLIDRGDAMLCPGCNTVLSKQQGCDWIKCAVCFLEICWATKGPRWGPKGKGDVTGGCMCGIPPGRKCHSDCKYCH